MMSSLVTSITVLLIVIFLFKEGFTLFNRSPIEKGMVMVVNKSNPVNALDAAEIKQIFDQQSTHWSDFKGTSDSIQLFRIDEIGNYYTDEQIGENFENIPVLLSRLLDSIPNMVAYVPQKYTQSGFRGKVLTVKAISLSQFLFGTQWFPSAQPAAQVGIMPLLLGTLWVSLIAILIALPFGLATAIYMAEIAHKRTRNLLKPVIELLAGIPSVVYGFFGLVIVVPEIQRLFNLPVGESALAGSIILAIMALPTIISISEDALRSTPRAMREASLALGATKWQTIARVVIPYSSSGITAGAILGIGRAVGETMAVIMVTGNAAVIPHSILEPVRTIPATIAAELGEAPQDSVHFKALFALGCVLFLFTSVINIIVAYISRKRK